MTQCSVRRHKMLSGINICTEPNATMARLPWRADEIGILTVTVYFPIVHVTAFLNAAGAPTCGGDDFTRYLGDGGRKNLSRGLSWLTLWGAA
jgi:hypothetical protein